ncbi:hypothetical protein [Novosphingobium sp.]|uniref:hypothetical protein n=1 Tax=Novosphingobium sp. TaxID=1874826 RepID=UPI0038B96E8C
MKTIASHRNARGIMRRGYRFSTGSVHIILTATGYHRTNYGNRTDSRNGNNRPPSARIAISRSP